MRTLQEANKIYTQRYRNKKRAEMGDKEYKEKWNEYMKEYKEKRMKEEGYVKPVVVKEIPLPKPQQPVKDIVLKPITNINKNTAKAKKQQINIEAQKSKLTLKVLSDKSIDNYLQNITVLHHDLVKQPLGKWRQEIIKVLKAQSYDEDGLKNELPYFKMNNIQATIKHLRNKYQNENTFKAKINSITSFLGRLKDFDKEYIYFSELGIKLQQEYTKVRDLNELTQEELDTINLIKFDKKDIARNIEKLDTLEEKALYAIYMYIPRRLEVREVRVRLNNNTKDTDKGNYVILNKFKVPDEFIFNSYKTDTSYGKQTINVPEEIEEILHEYIIDKKLKTNQYLFSLNRSNKELYDEGAFSKLFSSVFKKVYGKHITNQTMRIAYATYYNKRAKNVAEKKKYAEDLSHDLTTHLQYEKYNVIE